MNAKFTLILSLLVSLSVLSTSALYAQPANNECSGAINISALFNGSTNTSTLFDNTDATNEASDPALNNGASCFFENAVDNTVWFSFVGDGNDYTITSVECNATNYIEAGDTQMALYTGGCNSLTPVPGGCNEDGPGAGPGNFFAQVLIETTQGTTYYLMVDGYQAVSGQFCLEVASAVISTVCDAGTITTTGPIQVSGTEQTFDITVENFSIPNSPEQGNLFWIFIPGNDGAGGPQGGNPWGIPTSGMDTFTATVDGTAEPMTGTWEVNSRVTSTSSINDPCDESNNSLTVIFDAADPQPECEAGVMTTDGVVDVMGTEETYDLAVEGVLIPNVPTQGRLFWLFSPTENGGGGPFNGSGWIRQTDGEDTFNSTTNGASEAMTGTWQISSRVTNTSDPNDTCDESENFLTVNFDAADPQPECEAGVMVTDGEVDVAGITETYDLEVDNFLIPNTPTQGRLWWLFVPFENATGGPFDGSGWIQPTSGEDTFTSTTNGTTPAMTGTWRIFSRVTSSGDGNDVCDESENFLTVNFDILDPGPCSAGNLVTTDIQTVCAGQAVQLAIVEGTDTIPAGGGIGWLFDDTFDGENNGTSVIDADAVTSYTNDLNGNLGIPLEGLYSVKSFMYTIPSNPGASLCSISEDSILVVFGDVVDLNIFEDGDNLTAFLGPDFMDFTYTWSTGETGLTITPTTCCEFSVTATDMVGCETVATIDITPTSTNEADIVNNLSVSPNPTYGLLNVALDLPVSREVQLSVIDITGKEIINLAPVTFTSRNFEVDLQDQAAGLYLLRFRIGSDMVTRRVVKN